MKTTKWRTEQWETTSDSVSKKGLSNKERREHRPEWREWEPFGYVGDERNIQR